jgi:hypothetical protein
MKRLLFATLFLAVVAAGADVPKPIDLGTSDISICVAVPNLQTLIDNSEVFVKPFLGEAYQPGMIKSTIGGALLDPELTGLQLDRAAAFALFKDPPVDKPTTEPRWAIFLPAKSADAFAAVLKKVGWLTAFDNNLLIVAKSEASLKKAQELKAFYTKIVDAKIKSDGRVYLNVNALLETYTPLLKSQFEMIAPMMGVGAAMGKPDADPVAIQKMLKLEAKVAKSLISQIDVIQHDITLKPDALQIETVYAAKEATPLFDLLSSPPAGKNRTLGLFSKAGMMTAVARVDPLKASAAIERYVDTLAKDPAFTELLDDQVKAFIKQVASMSAGEFATTSSIQTETGIDQEAVCTAANEKAWMDVLEKMIDQVKPDGTLGKFYANMGMKINVSIEKNVREHAKVPINRRKMEFDTAKMTPDQAASIKAMAKDMDFAFAQGMFLSANRPEALDAMIDKVMDPAPKKDIELKSFQTFGSDKQIYVDADWSGMLKGIISLQPNNPAVLLLGRMKSTEPVALAGSFDQGRLFLQSNIPMAPFTDLAGAIRPLIMMRRQQRMQRPPGPPDKKDETF